MGRTARLQTARLRGALDLCDPAAGLRIESVNGEPLAGVALFGVLIDRLAAPDDQASLECFVRGDDLVARYAETSDRPFRVEVYWRSIECRDGESPVPIGGIDLILSVQTSRLEIDAELAICGALAGASECVCSDEKTFHRPPANGENYFLFRFGQSTTSYLEMAHPENSRPAEQLTERSMSSANELTHRLFVQRLEKGVILRSRIRGLFLPRDCELVHATAEYQRFVRSEPPLTA